MKGKGPVFSSLAAAGSVLAATTCCLPFGTILIATGLAGAARFVDAFRPWIVGGSILLLALAFYQAYNRRYCERRGKLTVAALWMASLAVIGLLVFPIAYSMWSGDRPPDGQPPLVALQRGNLAELTAPFNAAADRVRLLVMLSPT